jgi:hypothetical protein
MEVKRRRRFHQGCERDVVGENSKNDHHACLIDGRCDHVISDGFLGISMGKLWVIVIRPSVRINCQLDGKNLKALQLARPHMHRR